MAVGEGGSARRPGAGLITESDVEPGWPAAGSPIPRLRAAPSGRAVALILSILSLVSSTLQFAVDWPRRRGEVGDAMLGGERGGGVGSSGNGRGEVVPRWPIATARGAQQACG